MQQCDVILGSGSPRRRELLKLIWDDFTVITADTDEIISEEEPCQIVESLARQKAEAVLRKTSARDRLIIGADTLVFAGCEILGKPVDKEDARRMLELLSGKGHQVITGVALLQNGKCHTFSEVTDVVFSSMTATEIETYIASGDPMDKAGAYGIQGPAARYIKSIRGCYYNVVGLPVHRLYEEWKNFAL